MEPKSIIWGTRGLSFRKVQRRRVLLVNEDPERLQFYRTVLQAWGYQVRACACYEEGLRCLVTGAFDVVMVSQGSRGFEGRCVLERALKINRRLPVLVMARCPDMPCYLEAMQLGATDYLAEPVVVSEMERLFEAPQSALCSVD